MYDVVPNNDGSEPHDLFCSAQKSKIGRIERKFVISFEKLFLVNYSNKLALKMIKYCSYVD